jgi:hypothetical protein
MACCLKNSAIVLMYESWKYSYVILFFCKISFCLKSIIQIYVNKYLMDYVHFKGIEWNSKIAMES